MKLTITINADSVTVPDTSGKPLTREQIIAIMRVLAQDAGYKVSNYMPCIGAGLLIHDK